MRRALLVCGGTAVGLAAVLSYSGSPAGAELASSDSGLGAPPPVGSDDPATAPPPGTPSANATAPPPGTASETTAPASRAAAAPSAAGQGPAPTGAGPTAARAAVPTASTAPAPKVSSRASTSPTATPTAAPKPSPTPTTASATPTPAPAGPVDYVGAIKYHEHGAVQVAIRVQGGTIIAAWAEVYPTGNAQHYSDISIPVLKAETLQAQSAAIANVSGATLTSDAWRSSLKTALTKAGL